MRYLTPILLAVVVLSSGCDPDGYSCNFEGCYEDDNNPQFQTLEDCNSLCDEAQQLRSCGTPILHEGYIYSTVLIGDQCWFSENCRYLPSVSSSYGSQTANMNSFYPHYFVYGYDGCDVTAAKSTSNYETYGVLYNWHAVMTESICPSGWHIPSDEEFTQLTDYLGGESVAGEKMKSTSGWNNDGNGSNSSGFNGLPGGNFVEFDENEVNFSRIGEMGYWWSSSKPDSPSPSLPLYRYIVDNADDVYRQAYMQSKGYSARCVWER